MADPNLPKGIGVKCPEANIGEYVIVRNLTRGGQLTGKVTKSDGGVTFNPAPDLQWQNKDLIQAEIRGRLQGVKQGTIAAGGVVIRLIGTADTTTPGVSL